MSKYRFGLKLPPTRRWIESEWRVSGRGDRDQFVTDLLLQPERHLLPLLEGSSEDTSLHRQRLLENLLEVFGEQEIRTCLRVELDSILDRVDAAEAQVNRDE